MYKSTLGHIHDPVLLSQDRNNTFTFSLWVLVSSVESRFRSSFQLLVLLLIYNITNGILQWNLLITYVELIVIGLVVCVGVCVCAVSCGMAWIFILSGGSVLYWSVGICPFSGARARRGYCWWVFKRVSKIVFRNPENGHTRTLQYKTLTYLLTPWSRVLLEKLTSKLCS